MFDHHLHEVAEVDLGGPAPVECAFEPSDILKLLPFLTDAQFVVGSRTVQTLIFSGANMGPFFRWGNWAVAKLTEVLSTRRICPTSAVPSG